jgi:hypothetical protein
MPLAYERKDIIFDKTSQQSHKRGICRVYLGSGSMGRRDRRTGCRLGADVLWVRRYLGRGQQEAISAKMAYALLASDTKCYCPSMGPAEEAFFAEWLQVCTASVYFLKRRKREAGFLKTMKIPCHYEEKSIVGA